MYVPAWWRRYRIRRNLFFGPVILMAYVTGLLIFALTRGPTLIQIKTASIAWFIWVALVLGIILYFLFVWLLSGRIRDIFSLENRIEGVSLTTLNLVNIIFPIGIGILLWFISVELVIYYVATVAGTVIFAFGSLFMISRLAYNFLQITYNMNRREARQFLDHSLFTQPTIPPNMIVKGCETITGTNIERIQSVGGPARVVMRNNNAAILEKGGTLTRVIEPGQPHELKPFEKIYQLIDLRPKRLSTFVEGMTSEGLLVKWKVEIFYQFDSGKQEPTKEAPFPFNDEAIEPIINATWIRWLPSSSQPDVMNWENRILGASTGILRGILSERPLDSLIGVDQTQMSTAREAIRSMLQKKLTGFAAGVGAKIQRVELRNLQALDQITKQWVDAWKEPLLQRVDNVLAENEVTNILRDELTKHQGEIDALDSLIDSLDDMGDNQVITSAIFLRLFSELEKTKLEPGSRIFLPSQTLNMMNTLEDILGDDLFVGYDEGNDSSSGNGNSGGDNGRGLPPPTIDGEYTEQSNTQQDDHQYNIRLPIVDLIAAGAARPATDDDILGYLQQVGNLIFSTEGQKTDKFLWRAYPLNGSRLIFQGEYSYFVVQVDGDSMNQTQPISIEPGDYVILQRGNLVPHQPKTNDIVAVVFRDEDDHATLKRIFITRDGVMLQSESSNLHHQPQVIPPTDFAGENPKIEIVGVATAVLKQFSQYQLAMEFFKRAGLEIHEDRDTLS